MRCAECGAELDRLDNEHLVPCCGLTLQEYAIRHHLPLDLLVHPDLINLDPQLSDWEAPRTTAITPAAGAVLAGLSLAGLLVEEGDFIVIPGEVRRLDLLLRDLERLSALGFRYRQEYRYASGSHRVVARNVLRAPAGGLQARVPLPADRDAFLDAMAVCLAHAAEWHAGYIFCRVTEPGAAGELAGRLELQHGVRLKLLEDPGSDHTVLLRTTTTADAETLLELLASRLLPMPGVREALYETGPVAEVSKQLEFDSAHFITDHPGKCANLHGGRYTLHVKVRDRIQPATGFVLDYGDLKKVVRHRVVDLLDHQSLNYVDGTLAWRSSTELLGIWIWERLIDYLPGLSEIEIHETSSSSCRYSGPSLEQFQEQGRHPLLTHFTDGALGGNPLRERLIQRLSAQIKVVGEEQG